MISHRHRLRAYLSREIIDRPPVALWRHFPVDDQTPASLAEAHLAFQSLYDLDLVKVTPASSFSVRDWGVEDVWEGNSEGTRTYTRRVIQDPRDWRRIQPLDLSASGLAGQLECLRLIRARLGSDTPILQTVFSPLAQAKHLAGEDTLCGHLRSNPEDVEAALRAITETTSRFILAVAAMGIDGIFYAVQHAQASNLTRAEYLRFGHDTDLMLLESASGMWCNLLHLHGEDIYFDAVADYPVQVINWHDREAGPSIAQAAGIWTGGMCAGLSRQTLVFGTADDVRREAAEAFASAKPRPLLLSTGCVIPIITPHGNILAARHAADAFGGGKS